MRSKRGTLTIDEHDKEVMEIKRELTSLRNASVGRFDHMNMSLFCWVMLNLDAYTRLPITNPCISKSNGLS